MPDSLFHHFFQGEAYDFLVRTVVLALAEDGADRTSQALFRRGDRLKAQIVAKERTIVAGLPLMELVLGQCGKEQSWLVRPTIREGSVAARGKVVAELEGPALLLLRAERVMLNFLQHLSGIANQTRRYADLLEGSPTTLLDTRKTLPGLRYPEKYAVLLGGGHNHRMNLWEMVMLKDNHIDRAGGIRAAVAAIRTVYLDDCPPVVVECRTLAEVEDAVACNVDRIMLDNMELPLLEKALQGIPLGIGSEVSGGVSLETIASIARLGPDYISVGALTHSAPSADFSLRIEPPSREGCHG